MIIPKLDTIVEDQLNFSWLSFYQGAKAVKQNLSVAAIHQLFLTTSKLDHEDFTLKRAQNHVSRELKKEIDRVTTHIGS